jgi:molybdate transport system substrate-binding protein
MISKSFTIVVGTAFCVMTIVTAPFGAAKASEIKVLFVGSLRSSFKELAPSFEKSSGYKVKVEAGAAGEMVARIQKGELADVAVVTTPQMDKLVTEGKIARGTQVSISRSGMGLGAPKGAAKPDITSRESLQQVLSAAQIDRSY